MLQGFVAGELWSSVQVPSLTSYKLLLVHPEGASIDQREIVAVDLVGAGVKDRVLVALGRAARNAMGDENAPVEAAIIAVIDGLERDGPIPTSPLAGRNSSSDRTPVKKKPARKKKAKKQGEVSAPEETMDLFREEETEMDGNDAGLFGSETDPDTVKNDEMPGIDDVDRFWGDDEEEEGKN